MKKILALLILCLTFVSSTYAANVNVQINGKNIDFTDNNGARVEAQIINDRTMVPFRKIFNELGVNDENIKWDGETRTIVAQKEDTVIKLQIENKIAEKRVGDVVTKITLDQAPIISNNRTLVPLRFIAESLGKTVAWDSSNKTAIIIDYDYFLNQIKNKSASLYDFINKESNNINLTITRNYFDLEDSSKNNTAIVNARIIENKSGNTITDNVSVAFTGTNELMSEITSEGWSNIQFENVYYEDYFTTKALNDGLKKVYGQEQMTFDYKALNCDGKYNSNISDVFKLLCDIDEKLANISTFDERKNEFSSLLNKFSVSNANTLKTENLNSDDLSINYFDFTKFDNIIWDSSISRTYNFLNSQLFKFDLNLEELSYDFPTLNCTINVNNSELIIDFIGMNGYNEKVQYVVKIIK